MPLKALIEHKAIVSFLRKVDRLIEVSAFNEKHNIKINSLSNEVRKMFPADYEQDNIDAQQYLKQEYKNDTIRIYRKLSRKLFNNYNGKIVLAENMLENYNLYSTSIDIYPIFATYLLDLSKEFMDDNQRFNYVNAHLNEGYIYDGNLDKKFNLISDLHIHLGGALDFHYRVNDIIINPYNLSNINNHFQPLEHTLEDASNIFKNRFFILLSLYERVIISYYINNQIDNLEKLISIIEDIFYNSSSDYNIDIRLYELFKNNQNHIRNNYKPEYVTLNNTFENFIYNKAVNYFNNTLEKNYKNGDKTLIVFILYKFITEEKNSTMYHLIEGYFLLRNILKNIIFQQHRRSGFGYFSSYSKNEIKKTTNYNLGHIIDSVIHPYMHKNIEFRVSVHNNNSDLKNWMKGFHDAIYSKNRNKKANFRLFFHYIKKETNKKEKIYYYNLRKKYQHQTYVLSKFLSERAFRYYNGKFEKIDLAYTYFQGIDTAANELFTPPEVFAPIYNFFKKSVVSSGFAINDNTNELPKRIDLQYTYHVGEEFKDIISGIRSIFEAVVFLNLKNEDRIGHGVALGIDPNVFYKNRQNILLTNSEYMDNLVFLYYIFSMANIPIPYPLEEIKSKIEELGSIIYGKLMNDLELHFTIDDYISAWLLRRNCPYMINELYKNINIDEKDFKNDENELYKIAWNLKTIMKRYKKNYIDDLYTDSFNKAYAKTSLPDFINYFDDNDELFKKYLSIRHNRNAYIIFWYYSLNNHKEETNFKSYYKDSITFPYEVYEFLQDYIMENYIAKRDIIIEVMPTSNLLITPIKTYDEHPFLRFHPPKEIIPNKFKIRTKKIKIVIGTDNPGIQGTSLMMEYHIINNIISKKYSKRIAEKYLNEVANFSNYLFNKGIIG